MNQSNFNEIDSINYNLKFESINETINLDEIEFHNTDFIRNNLIDSKFNNCYFDNVVFDNCDLSNA